MWNDELLRQISLSAKMLHLYKSQIGLYIGWTVHPPIPLDAIFCTRLGGDLLHEGGTKARRHIGLCNFVIATDPNNFYAIAWDHCINCNYFWCLYGKLMSNHFFFIFLMCRVGVRSGSVVMLIESISLTIIVFCCCLLQRSLFIVNICVWTYFYVIVLMIFGVLLAIGQLFYPRSEFFIAVILFDLLMFGKCQSKEASQWWAKLTRDFSFFFSFSQLFLPHSQLLLSLPAPDKECSKGGLLCNIET